MHEQAEGLQAPLTFWGAGEPVSPRQRPVRLPPPSFPRPPLPARPAGVRSGRRPVGKLRSPIPQMGTLRFRAPRQLCKVTAGSGWRLPDRPWAPDP